MNHTASDQRDTCDHEEPKLPDRVVEALSAAVRRLRFGVVQLTVHDGRVVQLDVTERKRFT